MDSQMPKKIRKEQKALFEKYMKLPDGTEWKSFLENNASKEFLDYCSKKRARDLRLLSLGIIEN